MENEYNGTIFRSGLVHCTLSRICRFKDLDSLCGLMKLLLIAHIRAFDLVYKLTCVKKQFWVNNHQVTISQQHILTFFFSAPCSVTPPHSPLNKMAFSTTLSVLWKKNRRAYLTGKFTTRCLICLATGCVTPLCIHYRLKYRTSTFPC